MAVATSPLQWLVLLASLVPPGKVPPARCPCTPQPTDQWDSQGTEKGQGDGERGMKTSSRRAQRANFPFSSW